MRRKMEEDTFLTEKQTTVLKLKAEGLNQSEIAEKLGTTRANICSIEKRANKNIKKAEKTTNLAKKIQSPVTVTIGAGEDILKSVKKIFSEADKAGVHVSVGTPELISKIKEKAEERLKGRRSTGQIELSLTPDGEIIIL